MNSSRSVGSDSIFSVSACYEVFDSYFFYGLFRKHPRQCHILQDLYNAITKTKSWDFIAGQSYTNPNVLSKHQTNSLNDTSTHEHSCLSRVNNAIHYQHHTGQTYRWAMWHMKCIAKKGIEAYTQMMSENPERYIHCGRHSYMKTMKMI